MRLIKPVAVDVLATNVTESLPPWAANATYADSAIVTHNGPLPLYAYESLQDNNIGHTPPLLGDEWWLALGATNAYRMFDDRSNSRTVADAEDGSIRVTIRPTAGRIDHLALLNLRNVANVTVIVRSNNVERINESMSLVTSETPVGLWSYFFGERIFAPSYALTIPGYWYRPEIDIALTPISSGAPCECGTCLIGQSFNLGGTEWGAQPGLLDYSTFEKNLFGETTLVTRQNVRETQFTVHVETVEFDRIFSLFETTLGRQVLIDANNDGSNFDSLRVYGKVTAFRPGLRYAVTPIDITIEGIA